MEVRCESIRESPKVVVNAITVKEVKEELCKRIRGVYVKIKECVCEMLV